MNEKIIKQILKRLNRLEKTVFNKDTIAQAKKPRTSKIVSLPDLILRLRDQGFFKQPKIALEVHKKIQPIYPCDFNRVEVALLRLYKKRQLRKTSKIVKDKKNIAYVW